MRRILQIVLNGEGTVGGEQRHVLNVIDGLDPERYAIEVITWDIPPFVDELRRRGIPTRAVTSRTILDPILMWRLIRMIRTGRYDLVHAHGHRAGLLGRVASSAAGVPHMIWTCHLAGNKSDGHPVLRAGYAAVLRILDQSTDLTIAVSASLRGWLQEQGLAAARVLVVPNGVDRSVFHPRTPDPALMESLGLRPSDRVVGMVSRLTEQKGVDTFIEAAARMALLAPSTRFVIVGGGPLETEMRRSAAVLGVPVTFTGERTDIADMLALFDVVVVPSRWEGAFCFTVLEAMACRKPVVCSDIAPFTDVVEDGVQASVFRTGDAAALADAVMSLLASPHEADSMAETGRRLVEERFSVERLQASMSDAYGACLEEEES